MMEIRSEPASNRISGLVSIITPTFNSRKHIQETIQSVLDQTYPSWELLIVDDCSTDGTPEYVARSFVDIGDKIRVFRLSVFLSTKDVPKTQQMGPLIPSEDHSPKLACRYLSGFLTPPNCSKPTGPLAIRNQGRFS